MSGQGASVTLVTQTPTDRGRHHVRVTIGDLAQLVLAITGLAVAIYAVRRDRAVLRSRFVDAAAGTLIVSIVNVGLRPVRIEQLVRREGWIHRRDRDYPWSDAMEGVTTPLPVIVEAGHEIRVSIANSGFIPGHGRWCLVDAAGRRHTIE